VRCCNSGRYVEAEHHFGPKVAARDLARYRRKGPDPSSRTFLEAVGGQMRAGDSVLDIGAGVGVLSFECLSNGAHMATLVDASPAYLAAAASEADRRRVTARIQRVVGDFTAVADPIEPADVVMLHRVVCCYPDYESLLTSASVRARRLLAFSYPRDPWYIRGWFRLENGRRWLTRQKFRTFVHSPAAMDALVAEIGFRRIHHTRTFVWTIDVYARSG
jgi:predicted TPR repeat methyltransferase